MVDKIPWDTWVIALISSVFKTEFQKSTVIRFKLRCFTPPPPNTMSKLWRNNVYTCPTLKVGGWERGWADQVYMTSRVTVCLARLKKHHKCKFVSRLLSMIVVLRVSKSENCLERPSTSTSTLFYLALHFCSWMLNIHELRRHSYGTRSLTRFWLIYSFNLN